MTNHQFIHLRLHSAYSLAQGAIPVKLIPKLCAQNNMPAVAITDTANLFGALEFSLTCAKAGVQPIIGCQVNVFIDDVNQHGHMVLLAKNEEGYKHLLKLVSYSSIYPKENALLPLVSFAELLANHAGLIILTGGHKGLLAKLINKSMDEAKNFLNSIKEVIGDHLYIEIMRHNLDEQKLLEPDFLNLALELNVPIVATNDVFFKDPEMYQAHDALLCVAQGRYISEDDREKATMHHYFKSQEEMLELFSDLPEAVQNTINIAKRCHFMPQGRKPILPPFLTESGRCEQEELKIQALNGLNKRLEEEVFKRPNIDKEKTINDYNARLAYELDIINRMGFAGYFLIVSDFIKWAKSQNIPVGPGRGSGAGSLVAWVLTITDMDPIYFGLIFERFLNPERVSMPDFDVDFCQDRRDEVIQYVRRKYGDDKVAHIITFGKLQARAVLRDVGRVLQMSYNHVDKICKLIPNNPANPVTLEQALEIEPSLKAQAEQDETVGSLIDMGMKLEGLYRHASTHAAGVVIGDRSLWELIPLYKDEGSELFATGFSMKYVEEAGLVKFDFLGLKTLTVIEKCSEMIRAKGSEFANFNISRIPLDDPITFELLCNVDVIGVFQIESAGMRDVIRKLQPDRFEDIVALVALYRPGPMDDIPRYLARKHGEEKVTYLHPALKPILEPTYGVMVYQEQVMKIAQVLGGYTLGAADLLRRAMGKKIKAEMDMQQDLFIEGAIKNGVDRQTAVKIFEQMAKFAGYGFNKSHAAPYALLSYQTAYLKANHRLEFFAATMTYDIHNTDKLTLYRQDLENAGVMMLPPDVNYSKPLFAVQDNSVRYALSAIKNVGQAGMEELVQEREAHGKFKNLSDFVDRFNGHAVNKRQLENLIAAGAMDSLLTISNLDRRQAFDNVELLLNYNHTKRQNKASKQRLLFADKTDELNLPETGRWGLLERLQKEFDALGFYQSAHPLDAYKDTLKDLHLHNACDLADLAAGGVSAVSLVGVVLFKQERTSKKGQKFAFVGLSDTTGVYEIALFSEIYFSVRDFLEPGIAVYVTCGLKSEGEGYRLIANTIDLLDHKNQTNPVIIDINDTFNAHDFIKFMKTCSLGKTKIILNVNLPDLPKAKLTLSNSYNINADKRSIIESFALKS